MEVRRSTMLVLTAATVLAALPAARADQADDFFVAGTVQEIRLYFADPDWYRALLDAHAHDPEDPYFAARLVSGDLVLDPVGVRFKGNSSFGIAGVKKPFKIDFDEYDEGGDGDRTAFFGLTKLNLNNGFKDPTLLREVLFLGFCREHGPALRAVHARVFVNDQYWGLYTAVEQLDQAFIADRFGADEDGNLFEGEGPGGVFGSDLSYLGPDPEAYYPYYQLKTNTSANDWSDLIELTEVLHSTASEDLPALLEPILDVAGWLVALAEDLLFVNLDSYVGSAHNYYLYDRDSDGRLTYLHWDANEAFGSFRFGMAPGDDARTLPPLWRPQNPPQGGSFERPLMEQVWVVEEYRRRYLRTLARLLREGFDEDSFAERIDSLADLIRADVYADPHKPFTNADFETALVEDLGAGQQTTYGLRRFVAERASFLDAALDGFAEPSDIRINEVQTVNLDTVTDEGGDRDPWLELVNLGPGAVDLAQLALSDDPGQPGRWQLPAVRLEDGERFLVWLDGEPGQGSAHAGFEVGAGGATLHLSTAAGEAVDRVAVPVLAGDESLARLPDGDGLPVVTDRPTPGAVNLGPSTPPEVVINELMADNVSTIADPDGSGGHADWIELYNRGDREVDLGGLYLTDDPARPTRWRLPAGLSIGAGGHLLLWADADPEQGPEHLGFKLDADGETVALFDSDGNDNRPVDSLAFPALGEDVSYGRVVDGGAEVAILARPTPGRANAATPRRGRGRVGD